MEKEISSLFIDELFGASVQDVVKGVAAVLSKYHLKHVAQHLLNMPLDKAYQRCKDMYGIA